MVTPVPHLLLTLAALATATPAGAASPGITILYQFTGLADGANSGGPLLLDKNGNLYGTTIGGGLGTGVVFRLSPAAAPPWTLTVLHSFPKSLKSQVNPGLATDGNGNLYGTTYAFNSGLAFKLTQPLAPSAPWQYTQLTNFPGINSPLGGGASGVLSIDSTGTITGVTQYGGDQSGQFPCQCGVIYQLPPGPGRRPKTIITTFHPIPDGNIPVAGLTPAGPSLFYGTTYLGGTGQCLDGSDVGVVGCGTVFQLAQTPAGWQETILYNFPADEGNQPTDPIVLNRKGLFGYANLDVFRLQRDKTGHWHKLVIYRFPGGIAGTAPTGTIVFDQAGNLYGTTRSFGIDGPATIFKLTRSTIPNTEWNETTLATITTDSSAPQPWGGLTIGPDGTLYGAVNSLGGGTNPGYIFSIKP